MRKNGVISSVSSTCVLVCNWLQIKLYELLSFLVLASVLQTKLQFLSILYNNASHFQYLYSRYIIASKILIFVLQFLWGIRAKNRLQVFDRAEQFWFTSSFLLQQGIHPPTMKYGLQRPPDSITDNQGLMPEKIQIYGSNDHESKHREDYYKFSWNGAIPRSYKASNIFLDVLDMR